MNKSINIISASAIGHSGFYVTEFERTFSNGYLTERKSYLVEDGKLTVNVDDKVGWWINRRNTIPLAKLYNQYINSPLYAKDILIFCHDDCIIEDLYLVEKVRSALEVYDIVGLAGIKAPVTIKPPCLWHLMGDRSQYSGAVAHFDKKDPLKRFMTSFGPTPERVALLDGVFLALNVERILEKGLRFDENNPAGFHFYDLHFCLDANKLGLKCGTWPIWVTHKSHGLEKPTEDWLKGQEYFLKKYNS